METIGNILEWLTKYGIIDIFFGIGIIAYIREKLKNKVVNSIDGIEILPQMKPIDGVFEIIIKNSSKEPFYVYRLRFKPGYWINKVDSKTLNSLVQSLIFYSWSNGTLPQFYEPRNTKGEYLLSGSTKNIEEADALLLEPKDEASFPLGFEANDPAISSDKNIWQDILSRKECGLFRFHFVHGTNAGVFEVQL